MTTQQEVIDAFFQGEKNPKHASNLRQVSAQHTDQIRFLLIGDYAKGFAVLAKREPINNITVYDSSIRRSMVRMRTGYKLRIRRKVRQTAERLLEEGTEQLITIQSTGENRVENYPVRDKYESYL